MNQVIENIKGLDVGNLTIREMQPILEEIEKSKDIFLHVSSMNHGFTWGIFIRQIVEPFPGTLSNEILLSFDSNQSPYTFEQLAEFFNSDSNLGKLDYAEISRPKEEHYYDY